MKYSPPFPSLVCIFISAHHHRSHRTGLVIRQTPAIQLFNVKTMNGFIKGKSVIAQCSIGHSILYLSILGDLFSFYCTEKYIQTEIYPYLDIDTNVEFC